MTDEQERASEKKGRVKQIDVRNVEFEFVRKVEGENKLDEQNLTILSEPCTPHKASVAKKNLLNLRLGHLYRDQKRLYRQHGYQDHQPMYKECPQTLQLWHSSRALLRGVYKCKGEL